MKIQNFLFIQVLFSLVQFTTQNPEDTAPNSEIPEDTQGKEKEINEDAFTLEWRETMWDYENQYVYMIPVPYKSVQNFYENITLVPTQIRGAFILDETSKDKIDFKIRSPNGTLIYSNTTHACIFNINVTEPGFYQISFNNRYKNAEIRPSFTLNANQNLILKKDDITHTEKKLDQLITFLSSFGTQEKMKRNVHRERYQKILKTNKYFYTFSIIETVVLVVVSVWQFYYMKHLFEIKGSL